MLPGDPNWHVQVGMVVIRSPKFARTAGPIQHLVITLPFVLMKAQLACLGWPESYLLGGLHLKELQNGVSPFCDAWDSRRCDSHRLDCGQEVRLMPTSAAAVWRSSCGEADGKR